MHRHPDYTRERIRQVTERIKGLIYPDSTAAQTMRIAGPVDRISYSDAQNLEFRDAKFGEIPGPGWATFWLRASFEVPQEWAGQRVDLRFVSHSEATLWIDGKSIQGLNTGGSGERSDAILVREAKGGETLEVHVEIACNKKGDVRSGAVSSRADWLLERCDISRFDPQAWELYYDILVLRDLEADGDKDKDLDAAWGGRLLSELNRFCNIWDESSRDTWDEAGQILKALYQTRNGDYVHELSTIGHGHIDTAWLWPLAETWRKCERTFSSQTAYMDDYPEFRFACSQALQYEVIKERNPDLYARIKAKAAAGQWIPVGGTWIEPDCNLPSGEGLVRQFLYGQRFFEKEFGRRCNEFWNPDVFGYNGQLPQIMRGAGISRFLTQKLSWNRFNKPDHHTFTWQGIDGSEVLAHFPPADTYNANADVEEIRRNARQHKDHDRSQNSYMLFGYGDGGGGPNKTMFETLRRAKDLQGLPRTQMRTSDEFFEVLEAGITDRPVMVGELYFEYHRGTYTTQGATKKGNRRGEFLLHEIEFLATVAAREKGFVYPVEELDRLWKLLLLNQFHDILPGSSIREVYEDAERDYDELLGAGTALRDEVIAALATEDGESRPLNTTPFEREEVVLSPEGELVFVHAPSYGIGEVLDASTVENVRVAENDNIVLENAHLRAEISRDGSVVSLVEKASGRESLASAANVFEIYDDRPTSFDAWDVDPFHLETGKECPAATSCEIVRQDALRAEVRFERAVGVRSRLVQTVRLDAGSRRLEFHCEADWHEDHKMLKVAFPVNARAMNATYEMQFGVVERPTHYTNSFDLAKYEVPGHKWADLSEHGFGVAVLSESKYGWSTFGNMIRLSLLRAPGSPDPQADRGYHEFSYALMPHGGGWRDGGVVAEGFAFNSPVLWAKAAPRCIASCDSPNLVLDTIKKAEDSDALIVRLYETHGARGKATISLEMPFTSARRCNLLEDEGEEVETRRGEIEISYAPYEIISLKLAQ
ncbi:MAG TPA: alpha-mannosidase [Abditibacteriaceae bacterium]